MANDQTEPWPAGMSTDEIPLKQRWYKYRGRVLRTQKQMAHSGDVLYEQIKLQKKTKLAAEELPNARPASVTSLFLTCRPSAIGGFVIPVIIDPVEGQSSGA